MSAFFLACLAVAGLALICLPLFRKRQPEAFDRLLGFMEQEREQERAHGAAVARKTNQRASLLVPLRDRLAIRLQRTRLLQSEEGRDLLDWLEHQLVLGGVALTPQQALSFLLLCVAFALGFSFMLYSAGYQLMLVAPLLLAAYPVLKLRTLQANRRIEIEADIPLVLLDLMLTQSSGGTTLDHALARLGVEAESDPKPLTMELSRAVKEYQVAGMRREEALRGVAERTDSVAVRNFMETLITAFAVGSENLTVMLKGYMQQARAAWLNNLKTYIRGKVSLFTVMTVLVMFGCLTLIVGMIVCQHFG